MTKIDPLSLIETMALKRRYNTSFIGDKRIMLYANDEAWSVEYDAAEKVYIFFHNNTYEKKSRFHWQGDFDNPTQIFKYLDKRKIGRFHKRSRVDNKTIELMKTLHNKSK